MNSMRSWLRIAPLALLLLVVAVAPAISQTVGASLTGTLTDSSGGILKDVAVVAVNQRTQVGYTTKTNGAGVYTITSLPVGSYVVRAELQGFRKVETNAVTLETGQVARVNLKLDVVSVAGEELEVIAVNPILQTENATVGEIVTGSTVVALPLNGRNFAQLALLAPGVQTHSPDTFNSPKQSSDSGRPYVNGQREQSNNFMLDGIDQNEAVDNLVAYYPSPDAIAEMRIETNNYSAEFGNVAGGVISAITKSGTNEYHGNLFEFGRNDGLDANSWVNNRSQAAKADLKQNIFGGTFGGPILKNKLFFFADFQGQRTDHPDGQATGTVASEAWRNGDFSSLSTPILDPLTGLPFPGNVIPSDRISPIAKSILSNTAAYPLPNRPDLTKNNYVGSANQTTRNSQGDLKVDATLSQADNIFVRASVGKFDTEQAEALYPLAMGAGYLSKTQSFAANWTHTFGAGSVNELRAGFSHVTINSTPVDPGNVGDFDQASGIPVPQVIPGLSALNFGNSGLDAIGTNGVAHDTNDKVYELSEKLSISHGRHFVSVGGQFLHYNMNQLYATNSGLLGTFNFGGAGFGTGSGFANFLLGDVAQKQVLLGGGSAADWTQLQDRVGLFVQDDWKPTSNLTVNLGLRWEYASPIREKDNKQVNWDVNTGAQILPGGAFGDALYDAYYGGFSPRLGFAWTANSKTVVRGGFGLVQYQEGTGANCRLPINPPFYIEVTKNYQNSAPGNLAVGFNDLGTADAPDLKSVQLRAWQTDLQPQLTKQWNVFVERQLTSTTSLNVGYVGSRSTHVATFNDDNMYLPGTGDPSTWAPLDQRRRLPQYGFIRLTASNGVINYDGLQASLRHRMANGLEFLVSYTFSKALSDNQGFYGPGWGSGSGNRSATQSTAGQDGDGNYDAYNLGLDYGPEWFSSQHNLSLAANYQLPFGKGRKIGSDWSGVEQVVLGGWNLSGILTMRSGLPITVVEGFGPGQSLQSSGFVEERPDRVPGQSPLAANPDWGGWLNPAAFTTQALGTFGNSGVGIARGPGFYNLDMGIDKAFALGGARALALRLEAFNVLNHPNMGLPIRDITDPNFGQILETASSQRILEFAAKFTF
jgi:Carboxypeptidase regulatory-like domain/TonB dependent receptor